MVSMRHVQANPPDLGPDALREFLRAYGAGELERRRFDAASRAA